MYLEDFVTHSSGGDHHNSIKAAVHRVSAGVFLRSVPGLLLFVSESASARTISPPGTSYRVTVQDKVRSA
ncbi:hypothetical protein GCM10009804_38250 [Kribbella hippodromi]|uniref:Uncharacterized protein n=1 Tax=Kribbella hippodromi TaxID=434347 RepID=A0ABN2DI51_9ACTN